MELESKRCFPVKGEGQVHILKEIYCSPDLVGVKRVTGLQRLKHHRLKPYYFVLLDCPSTENQLEIYSGLEWNRGRLDDRRVLGLSSNFISARLLILGMVKESLSMGYEGNLKRLLEEERL